MNIVSLCCNSPFRLNRSLAGPEVLNRWTEIEPSLTLRSKLPGELSPFLRHDRTHIKLVKRNDLNVMRATKSLEDYALHTLAGNRLVKFNNEIAFLKSR